MLPIALQGMEADSGRGAFSSRAEKSHLASLEVENHQITVNEKYWEEPTARTGVSLVL